MSAEFRQRMPDDLHKRAKDLAKKLGMSLNAFVNMSVHERVLDLDELEKRVAAIEQKLESDNKK